MDEQGKLSADELAIVTHLLENKLKSACWNCGEQSWLIYPTVLGEAFYDGKGQFLTSAHMAPKVRLTCKECGNIAYFSAESMGLKGEAGSG